MLEIRTLQASEAELLHRFLERSFGHGWGWFYRRRPALAQIDFMTKHCIVGIHNGHIVSHVGAYPLSIVAGPAQVMCGGIGSVATLPEARGKGYMSKMLPAAVQYMVERGWPISVLWGDRQRYARFGWERAGSLLHITLNKRSVKGCESVDIEDVDPTDSENVRRITELHDMLTYRIQRSDVYHMLQAADIRLFLGPDGYVLSTGARAGDLHVVEVSSPTGKEVELVASAMKRADAETAMVIMEPVTNDRTERMLAAAAHWYLESRAMFRMLHWPSFIKSMAPLLAERAQNVTPFSVSITCYDDTMDLLETTATIRWDGQKITVTEGGREGIHVRLESRQLIRLILGVPTIQYDGWGPFQKLLPLPLHIPRFDFV